MLKSRKKSKLIGCSSSKWIGSRGEEMFKKPLKFNMEPEKKSLEKVPRPSFSGSMLNFGGVSLSANSGYKIKVETCHCFPAKYSSSKSRMSCDRLQTTEVQLHSSADHSPHSDSPAPKNDGKPFVIAWRIIPVSKWLVTPIYKP